VHYCVDDDGDGDDGDDGDGDDDGDGGERAFSWAAPHLWNALPTDIKRAATLLTFKKETQDCSFLKTSVLILLYFIIACLVHIAYVSVNSWLSSHVSCSVLFRLD